MSLDEQYVAALQRAVELARTVQDAPDEARAYDAVLSVCRDLVGASRAHVYLLDAARTPSLARSTAKPSADEAALCDMAVRDALERHKKKEDLAGQVLPDGKSLETDETIELALVAKVIANEGRPLAVAVIVKETGIPFTLLERRQFSSLCLSAGSGLARRTPRKVDPSALDKLKLPEAKKAAEKIKTGILKRPKDLFDKPLGGLLGRSAQIKEVRERLYRYAQAPAEFSVLILGESGTGKELAARAIHDLSSRKAKPYVAMNCASVPQTLVETSLFGHAKGSFTGAHADAKGVLRSADGGSLFLDEVGELPTTMQATLLRTLETGEVTPIGGAKTIRVDVRVVAATNRDLAAMTKVDEFRLDLYQRLNVLDLVLPPLRERREDIPILAQHFLDTLPPTVAKPELSPGALRALEGAPWEGNVRDLRNVIRRAAVLASGRTIDLEHLRLDEGPGEPLLSPVDQAIRKAIMKVLRANRGNKTKSAQTLEMHVNTLRSEIKRLGIPDQKGD